MAAETGESTAQINRRADVNAWNSVCVALMDGGVLYRPKGLTRYFTKCKDPDHRCDGIGVSAVFVKEMEALGNITRLGVDTYGIGTAWKQAHGKSAEVDSAPVQLTMF